MSREDQWLKQIKDKIEDHQEVVPPMLWDKIATDLSLLGTQPKLIPFYRKPKTWLLAAAVLVGVSWGALYLHKEEATIPNAEQQKVYVAQDPYLNQVLDELQVSNQLPENITSEELKTNKHNPSISKSSAKPMLFAAYSAKVEDYSAQNKALMADSAELDMVSSAPSADVVVEEIEEAVEESVATQSNPKKYDDLYAHLRSRSYSSSSDDHDRASRLSLHAGGSGKILGGGITGVETQSVFREVSLDSFTSPSAFESPKPVQMFIRNGVPYVKDDVKVNDYKHNQPISFGLSYSYALNKYLALESGLVYTYLSSDVTEIATQEKFKQKFHYLGIPIKLYWSFFRHNKLSLYASGGGMVELAVAGKVGGENKRPTRPQFSALAGVGAQYSFSRVFGLYIEPGVAYYFNDGSHIETIRTEKPFNFNLNAGVRLTF